MVDYPKKNVDVVKSISNIKMHEGVKCMIFSHFLHGIIFEQFHLSGEVRRSGLWLSMTATRCKQQKSELPIQHDAKCELKHVSDNYMYNNAIIEDIRFLFVPIVSLHSAR